MLLVILQVAHFGEGVRPDHRPDRDRIGGIEALHGLVGRQKGVDFGLVGKIDALDRVGENEAVGAHHGRHRQFLRQAEGDDVQVGRLLVRFSEELDPARFAERHRVGMVIPDVDRRADRAVSQGHHDRQAEAGRVVDSLRHEEQALARGRGIGARAGGRGADGDRKRRELALDIDELRIVEFAETDQFAETLDDMGLRRDRIGADDLRPAKRNRARHRLRAFDLVQHRRIRLPWSF